MPETPDFEKIASQILDRSPLINVDWKRITAASIAEQLRLVWNARGAADIAKIETILEQPRREVPPRIVTVTTFDLALRRLDR